MWSIFIALFCGLYLVFKTGNDRLKLNAADQKMCDWRNSYDLWRSRVLDNGLNHKTLSMVDSEEGFQILKQRAMIVIRQLPGLKHANMKGRISHPARHMVRLIEMVSHGKLPHGEENWLSASIWNCLDLEFSKKAKVEFVRWIERTMQQQGVADAKLYYNVIGDNEVFEWGQHILSFDDTVSVDNINLESFLR